MTEHRMIMVSGLSGAGLSSALKALEDLGYEAIDNLPLPLLGALADQGDLLRRHVAVGVDSRTRGFSVEALLARREALTGQDGVAPMLLFLDCSDEVLERRFTETRRRHPLALDRPVADGIARERQILEPLKAAADLVIDTTALSIHELRRLIGGHFEFDRRHALQVFITSFSYRFGIPRHADLVFDVRFLKNPHYDPALKPLTGRDAAVGEAIMQDPDFASFEASLLAMLRPLLPRYQAEGKHYLTIAIGCTGGKHRSVFLAERLYAALAGSGFDMHLAHRDLPQA
jgi:RNase adapter protein RapZ